MKKFAFLSTLIFFCPVGQAQDSPPGSLSPTLAINELRIKALEEQVRSLADEVALLRAELKEMRAIKSAQPLTSDPVLLASNYVAPGLSPAAATPVSTTSAAPAQPPAPAQVAQTQSYGGATSNAKLLNPDISLIGDFIGVAGHNSASPSSSLQLHESELGLQAIIDPYARGDVFFSFGEEGVNVEEGYITFTSLPAGLLVKAGKMRSEFGKVNLLHNHALPFIDRPLVTNNLVGGEDGISDAGISVSRFLPAPKDWFVQGTAQVYHGDSGDVFHAFDRQDISVVGHLRAYRDLGESTNIELGGSYARGHNAAGIGSTYNINDFLTNLYDLDATLRWKPLRRAIYHSLLFRNEFVWSARDQLSNGSSGFFETQHAFGFYSNVEYRLNRRWTIGGRFDRSRHADDGNLIDTGSSVILTYWPSEFSQIRGQYRFGHLPDRSGPQYSYANEFLFQFLWVMGAHGAHPF